MDLSTEAQQLYDNIRRDQGINDQPGLLLLKTAFEAFDEMREAQEKMNPGGYIEDRFGQRKKDPAALNARAARAQMLQALKALDIDIEKNKLDSIKDKLRPVKNF